ncbi:MAG: preprotein translocase subunit SecE [Micrococcales bacterium]|nr:preprotein translocase subunit SecE [Actinomycetota bacterium]NCA08368.1 preprotein translocase subunit SecE [Micrococcales bacterium]
MSLKVSPALTERREMSEELEQASEDLVETSKANRAQARGPIGRIILFLQQVIAELRKVNRPTYSELRNYTGVVLGFVVVVMAIIFGLDFIFGQGVIWLYTAFNTTK